MGGEEDRANESNRGGPIITKRGWYRCEECKGKKAFLSLLDSPYEIVRNIEDGRTRWYFCSIKCLKAWVEKQEDWTDRRKRKKV